MMIIKLAWFKDFQDKIKTTEMKLGNLLFCYKPNHLVGMESLILKEVE